MSLPKKIGDVVIHWDFCWSPILVADIDHTSFHEGFVNAEVTRKITQGREFERNVKF